MPLNILFTGSFDPAYNRTAILRAGLIKLGHTITDLPLTSRTRADARRIAELAKAADFVFLPPFTHKDVPFVRKAAPASKLVFDPLVSRYMTKALDYKKISRFGLGAFLNKRYDRKALEAADLVITDTRAHLEWFSSAYGVPENKMGVVYIGNDFNEFSPGPEPERGGVFTAGFYGGFIPLQGTLAILKAAELLRGRGDVRFRLIGTGFEYKKALAFAQERKLGNVDFPGWLTPAELCKEIRLFDAALGIFGDTLKAGLVIPNKLFHYAACRRPVITRDTPAARELFSDAALLVDNSPESIAAGILKLKENQALAARLARRGWEVAQAHDEKATASALLAHIYGPLPRP